MGCHCHSPFVGPLCDPLSRAPGLAKLGARQRGTGDPRLVRTGRSSGGCSQAPCTAPSRPPGRPRSAGGSLPPPAAQRPVGGQGAPAERGRGPKSRISVWKPLEVGHGARVAWAGLVTPSDGKPDGAADQTHSRYRSTSRCLSGLLPDFREGTGTFCGVLLHAVASSPRIRPEKGRGRPHCASRSARPADHNSQACSGRQQPSGGQSSSVTGSSA